MAGPKQVPSEEASENQPHPSKTRKDGPPESFLQLQGPANGYLTDGLAALKDGALNC